MIRVFLADDHTLVRQGIKRILQGEPDMQVVGEAADSYAALRAASEVPIDVMVLDLSMPGPGGLEVLAELRDRRAKPPVLVVSMHPEARFAIRAFRLGAAGYMTKERAAEDLVLAIRRICGGGKYITPEVADLLACCWGEEDAVPHEKLSPRELSVFQALASGERVAEIARSLGLTVATVYTYRARIFEKMNFKSTAELVRYAATHSLLD
jgi:DNA-binding NarL/FixJ family response regulator